MKSRTLLVIAILSLSLTASSARPASAYAARIPGGQASQPSTDAPFDSEEVTFQNDDVTLAGTLTIPKGKTERLPAAVMISGSGVQNRDGNPGGYFLLKLIAERLSSVGIAVLRHDDRWVGKSSKPTKPGSYRSFVNDTKAAVEYLRGRKEIDQNRIMLVGHSEGGTTAAIIASEDSRIAAIALLAGAMLSGLEKTLHEQTLYQMALMGMADPSDQEKVPPIVRMITRQIEEAKAGKPNTHVAENYEYFRQHLALDLPAIFKQVRCPVLILQGERDPLVLAHHAVEVARLLAASGNKHVRLRILLNLTHSFTPFPLDKSLTQEQRNQVSAEALDTIEKWATSLPAPVSPARQ